MPKIEIITHIKSDINTVFDLSRSIDLHLISSSKTKEKAIGGRTNGLIEMDEIVVWEAIHFGLKQNLTSKITAYNRPFHFRDEQQKGAFKSFIHDHYFEKKDEFTIMKDVFDFKSPFGPIGYLFNKLILTKYMTSFLINRNEVIKKYAESQKTTI